MQLDQTLFDTAIYQMTLDNMKTRGYIVNSTTTNIKKSEIRALILKV